MIAGSRYMMLAIWLTVVALPTRAEDKAPATDDEAIMRPTTGPRFTPRLGRALARHWVVQQFTDELTLGRQQERDVAEVMYRRMASHPMAGGEGATRFVEYLLEAEIAVEPEFTPATARDFAERNKWLPEAERQFYDGLAKDVRPLLNAEQQVRLDEWRRGVERHANRFEAKLKRWAAGGAEQGERPFRWTDAERAADPDENDARPHNVRMAESWAMWDMRSHGPEAWMRFVDQSEGFFGFTAEQLAAAQRLLGDYRERARSIMTEDWKKRVRENRVQDGLLGMLEWGGPEGQSRVPIRPQRYLLQREYDELMAPVKELGKRFREEILALVSQEQREAGLAEFREFGTARGLSPEGLAGMDKRLVDLGRGKVAEEVESK